MTIREATTEDLNTMGILWRMMVKEINPGAQMNSVWWYKYQEELIGTGIYKAYVAIVCGEMVGYVTGSLYPDAISGDMVAFGQEFYIMPEFRNENLASKLYSKIMKLGKERGASAVEMICYKDQLEMWRKKGYDIQKYHVRRSL